MIYFHISSPSLPLSYTHKHTDTHIYTRYSLTHRHTDIDTLDTHTHKIHTHMHTHTDTHIYTQTLTTTHIHTHTRTISFFLSNTISFSRALVCLQKINGVFYM